tara:strand:- start:12181 stop:12327 length:147 start_codon:yes stop_codon:yes gene_type:complete
MFEKFIRFFKKNKDDDLELDYINYTDPYLAQLNKKEKNIEESNNEFLE